MSSEVASFLDPLLPLSATADPARFKLSETKIGQPVDITYFVEFIGEVIFGDTIGLTFIEVENSDTPSPFLVKQDATTSYGGAISIDKVSEAS